MVYFQIFILSSPHIYAANALVYTVYTFFLLIWVIDTQLMSLSCFHMHCFVIFGAVLFYSGLHCTFIFAFFWTNSTPTAHVLILLININYNYCNFELVTMVKWLIEIQAAFYVGLPATEPVYIRCISKADMYYPPL